MATFNIASIEAPAKKKVSLKALDKAITEYINGEESTFTVTMDGAKPVEIVFSTFVTPILYKAYIDMLLGACVQTEPTTGIVMVDKPLVELMTYWFILERLSDMPLPTLSGDNGATGDVATDKVSAYGAYFNKVSSDFRELGNALGQAGIAACEEVAELLRDASAVALESADVNALLQNPEVLEMIKDGFSASK